MHSLHTAAARLLSIELYAVTLAVLASVASERLLPLAAAIAAAFWLARLGHWLTRPAGAPSAPTPHLFRRLRPFIGLLILTLGVTWIVTAFPDLTRPQVLRVLTGLALFFAMANWLRAQPAREMARLRWIMRILIALGLALAVVAPFVVSWEAGPMVALLTVARDTGAALFGSEIVNPNVLAGALVIVLPLPLGWLSFGNSELRGADRAFAAVATAAMLLMLLLTQSRGAFLALACALVTLSVLRWPKLSIPLAGALTLLLAWAVLYPTQRTTIFDAALSGGAIGGLDNRVEIWSRGWYLIQDFMFTGIGMGSFSPVVDLLYPLILTKEVIPHAHNLFLQVAVDLGLPGFIAWLGILINVITACAMLIRTRDPLLRAIGAGLLASNVALCVHGLTDAVTWGMVRTAPLVWALWGLAVAAGIIAEQRARQPQALAREPAEK